MQYLLKEFLKHIYNMILQFWEYIPKESLNLFTHVCSSLVHNNQKGEINQMSTDGELMNKKQCISAVVCY